MSSKDGVNAQLNHKTFLGLNLWVVIGISCAALLLFVLIILSICLSRRKSRLNLDKLPHNQIPDISKEITVDRIAGNTLAQSFSEHEGPMLAYHDKFSDKDSRRMLDPLTKSSDADNLSQCSSVYHDKAGSSYSGDEEQYGQALEQHVPLIYGLPDDLAILCVSRVPRQFHHVLRRVSRRWRALLCSKEFHACRSRQNQRETWVYALCVNKYRTSSCYVLDPYASGRNWKLLLPIPSNCMRREGMAFEALGTKLFLLGGRSCQENVTNEVYCYDTLTEKWEEAAGMPTARCYFLSAAMDDKIYVTGGIGMSSDAPATWDIYDCHSNNWTSYQDAAPIPDIVNFFIFQDKVYTILHTLVDRLLARAYDPSSRKWEDANQKMSLCACCPTVVVEGTLYMLGETFGTELMMWRNETEEWVPLGRPAQMQAKPPFQLVAVGSCIFMVGRELRTFAVDTEKAGRVEGVLLASSIVPKLYNHLRVIGCKTISL